MKRCLPFLFALTCSVLFWQCESAIELDDSGFVPKLVINAQMSADNRFTVDVSVSATPTGQLTDELPEGLEVTVTNVTEGAEVPLYQENGTFLTHPEVSVIPGAEYMVKATAPGFVGVSAMTRIPQSLQIDSIVVENLVILPSEVTSSKTNVSYTIRIDVPAGSEEFLHMIFTQTSTRLGNASIPPSTLTYDIEPEFPEESGYTQHVERGVLVSLREIHSDQLEFTFRDFTIDAVGEELGNIKLEVRTVSEEYYEFFVTMAQQINTIKDPFAQPVPVFNNIEGGYGNFSGFNSVFYEFSLF